MDRRSALSGAGLALGSMFSVQLGAAVAVPAMALHGSVGITALRLICAAAALALLVRPRLRRFDGRQWRAALLLGLAMAGMTMAYFAAVLRIPLGAATTIDFIGPLAVAALSLKGWPRLALPALALLGVMAITRSATGWLLDPIGVGFALVSAAGWGSYIVLMRHVGRLFQGQEGLCLSLLAAALASLPFAATIDPAGLAPAQWPVAAGLALLVPLIPYSLEMVALRRVNMGAFSILMSLEPAIGATLGFVVLAQALTLQQGLGVAAVVLASAGAVHFAPETAPAEECSGNIDEDVIPG